MRLRDYHKIDSSLALAIFGLSIFGLLMLYSASSELSRQRTGNSADSTHYLVLQLVSFVIGITAWVVLQQIDYRRYKKFGWWWGVISLLLLVSITFLSKGAVNGAHRWIAVAGQSFQPSEFVKITVILFLASWFSDNHRDIASWQRGLLPFLGILALLSAFMLQQKDLGTLGVLVTIAIAMYAVSGARLSHLGITVASLIAVAALAIKIAPFRLQRLTAFLNPDQSLQGAGYHINQSKIAIGLGGLWGKGFLQGTQKKGFLPEAHTDSIFAVIVEELGFIRASIVILVYLFIAVRGFRIAKYAPDSFGMLLAVGITTWFAAQSLINIAAMVSIIPLTGVPLPFISYGRTALVAAFCAVGILLNVSRYVEER